MTARELLDHADIADVWRALGGGDLRHGRGKAFWRQSLDYNISVDTGKNCYFDHAHGTGGGILSLIQTVLGCDRSAALRWLANHHNVQLDGRPLTSQEKRAYAIRRGEAERKADELTDWRRDRLRGLRRDRNRRYLSENGTCAIARTLLATGDGTEEQWAAIWARAHDHLGADEIQREIVRIESATPAELYAEMERAA